LQLFIILNQTLILALCPSHLLGPGKASYMLFTKAKLLTWACCSLLFALSGVPALALNSPTSIFAPDSTPARSIFGLSMLVLSITGLIFVAVFSLLVYAVVRFRQRDTDDHREPPQVYGSTQIEMAWTIIPLLIVLVLFLATARVVVGIQNANEPHNALEVTVVGHQYWWEYRYPQYNVVTANELHVPVSDPARPTPTFLTLLSADTDHSFWVPRLAGKTDLIPNHPNRMWIDPQQTGVYLGQCAQYCGIQHAKMLIRVYVQSQADFDRWIQEQSRSAVMADAVARGRVVFETSECLSCHSVKGIAGNGTFGPDLTHLMSRDTIASGAAPNTAENLRKWINDPNSIKPGATMPAMQLTDKQLDDVTAYLESLR
jgi:cytochrome c oxidase subunit II